MIAFALIAFLSSTTSVPSPMATGVEVAQLTITRSIIIRVPARRSRRYADAVPAPPRFKDRKGPKCIDASTIGAAAVTAPDSVDFILKGGKRVRAKLEDECPALDYYAGFYVKPPADGKICADRDSIHTRSGGDCQIDKFRTLTPIPPGH